MTGSNTIAGPQEYWDRYYAQQFRFGLGTEDILAALVQIPPVRTWADLGSGSESMLWAIGLCAQRLVAVDADPQRLTMVRTFTSAVRPRGAHRTALALCGRTDPHDCFTAAHQLVKPGGWAAGANWVARNPYQRVELTERLYQIAAARAGIDLLLTREVPITADPDFTAVWTYIGRKHRHGHCGARHAVSDTRRATAAG